MMEASRIALGTVQFGLDYGISNAKGRVSEDEAFSILSSAATCGVCALDTARGYGTSESVLGKYFAKNPRDREKFQVITKVSAPDVQREFESSLTNLNEDSVDTLLLHRESDLDGPQADSIWKALESLKSSGRVRKIGVSCYSPEALLRILDRYRLDTIQVPFNAFERSFGSSKLVEIYKSKGIEVHVRSVFIQGLLFLTAETCPEKMKFARATLAELGRVSQGLGATPAALSLAIARAQSWVSKIVIGVTSALELRDVLAWKLPPVASETESALMDLRRRCDPRVFDPRQW